MPVYLVRSSKGDLLVARDPVCQSQNVPGDLPLLITNVDYQLVAFDSTEDANVRDSQLNYTNNIGLAVSMIWLVDQ